MQTLAINANLISMNKFTAMLASATVTAALTASLMPAASAQSSNIFGMSSMNTPSTSKPSVTGKPTTPPTPSTTSISPEPSTPSTLCESSTHSETSEPIDWQTDVDNYTPTYDADHVLEWFIQTNGIERTSDLNCLAEEELQKALDGEMKWTNTSAPFSTIQEFYPERGYITIIYRYPVTQFPTVIHRDEAIIEEQWSQWGDLAVAEARLNRERKYLHEIGWAAMYKDGHYYQAVTSWSKGAALKEQESMK